MWQRLGMVLTLPLMCQLAGCTGALGEEPLQPVYTWSNLLLLGSSGGNQQELQSPSQAALRVAKQCTLLSLFSRQCHDGAREKEEH